MKWPFAHGTGVALALTALLPVPPVSAASPPRYDVRDLGGLDAGFVNTVANAINASGQVVGYSQVLVGASSHVPHAFLFTDGLMTDLGTLEGGLQSEARGINASGQVVGTSSAVGQTLFRAVLFGDEGVVDLDPLGGGEAVAHGINDLGEIVGRASSPNSGFNRAFLIDRYGNKIDLHLELSDGARQSTANAINNSGEVVGSFQDGCGHHAFLYNGAGAMIAITQGCPDTAFATAVATSGKIAGSRDGHAFLYDGAIRELGTLGGPSSFAFGINASGQVVGASQTVGSEQHAFLYTGGMMHDLDDLIPIGSGWTLLQANAINDGGQIVGVGLVEGDIHSFLLTPTPSGRIQNLIDLVRSFGLPQGTENSFIVKLDAVLAALAAGDSAGVCSALTDFINHAKALRGKKLTLDQGDQLIAGASEVKTALGCP